MPRTHGRAIVTDIRGAIRSSDMVLVLWSTVAVAVTFAVLHCSCRKKFTMSSALATRHDFRAPLRAAITNGHFSPLSIPFPVLYIFLLRLEFMEQLTLGYD
jgi:hypothetical protein